MQRPPRVLVTRSPQQASELAERLRALGAEPILIPAIETVDPTSFEVLDRALENLGSFHWLIFTSANAVHAFRHRLNAEQVDVLSSKGFSEPTKTAAIGMATARALKAIDLSADLIPSQAVAESLTDALLPYARQPDGRPTRFLLIRAEEAREHLPETLRGAGAEVTVAPAYKTAMPAGSVNAIRKLFRKPENRPDAITFTSSSTARNLFALLEAAGITLPAGTIRASIGPITSATLCDLGHPPQVEAADASVASLAVGLIGYWNLNKRA